MAEQNDRAFTGSIPALYERYMVPLLFVPYAEDLAARAKALAPRRLLEIAAGTGVVTRVLAASLPATAITATDLNEAMLDFAITKLTARHVTWRPADGQALPFPDASFDMVVCQFGIMFFPDRVRGFREARRVLAPGGRYLFSVWADLGANDFPEAITEALVQDVFDLRCLVIADPVSNTPLIVLVGRHVNVTAESSGQAAIS